VTALRVLLIEDHRDIAELLTDYLEGQGMVVDYAADGVSGLHLAVTIPCDVIVLDLGLPGMDGLELCRQLRQQARSDVPVLMLSARDALADKLQGFERGADDYLVKPFELAEVAARVAALHRRARPGGQQDEHHYAGLSLRTRTREVSRDGTPIELKPIPFAILDVLLRAAPNVVTRAELKQAVWGDEPPDSDALRTHIVALRGAIDKPFAQPLLQTVHGVGFRLRKPE
jgi:DNA-binding response OmpR family regulator